MKLCCQSIFSSCATFSLMFFVLRRLKGVETEVDPIDNNRRCNCLGRKAGRGWSEGGGGGGEGENRGRVDE